MVVHIMYRWYNDKSGEKSDAGSLPVSLESHPSRSVSSSLVTDSSLTVVGHHLELATPKLDCGSQLPELERPQSSKQIAETIGENPVVIENSDDHRDSSAFGIETNPECDLNNETKQRTVKNSTEVCHMDFSPHSEEGCPTWRKDENPEHFNDHPSKPGQSSAGSSRQLERDC